MPWKKATLFALIGFIIGALIGIGFLLADRERPGLMEALPHILVGGVYGAVAMGSSIVYDIESWSIARATVTHFLACFGLYFLIVITMGWFRLDDPTFWMVIALMVIAYVLIWLFQYLSYKRTIRKMNQELVHMKSKAGKEEAPRR